MFTFGFYNSLGGDRKYNAVQISRLFEGIINDGVFASIGDSLMVTPGAGGMTVNVGTGRAWFNNTWNDNDALMPITLDPSEAVLNRIDAIVLEVQDAPDVRTNSIKKIKGTPASVPVPPTMINMTGHHQYPLAHIYVGAGVTKITADNITNKINTIDCPFVTVVGLDALLPEWQEQFEVWFAALQAQMSGDVATNLQNQINALNARYGTCSTDGATAAKVATLPDFSLISGRIVGIKFTNANTAVSPTLNVNNTGAKPIYVNGVAVTNQITDGMVAIFQYDGTNWVLLNPDPTAKSLLQIYNTAQTTNYTVPAGVKYILAVIVGAGGGGGGGAYGSSLAGGGGGGGGGYVTCVIIPVTQGQVIPIVVGTGGVGGLGANQGQPRVVSGGDGGDGGTSSVNGFVSEGGKGGKGGMNIEPYYGLGGLGSAVGAHGRYGNDAQVGGAPGSGITTFQGLGMIGAMNFATAQLICAGGGGGGGTNQAPNNAGTAGGIGIIGNGGTGGNGSKSVTGATVGTAGGPGCGGGGGGSNSGGVGANGGAGGPGYVALYSVAFPSIL